MDHSGDVDLALTDAAAHGSGLEQLAIALGVTDGCHLARRQVEALDQLTQPFPLVRRPDMLDEAINESGAMSVVGTELAREPLDGNAPSRRDDRSDDATRAQQRECLLGPRRESEIRQIRRQLLGRVRAIPRRHLLAGGADAGDVAEVEALEEALEPRALVLTADRACDRVDAGAAADERAVEIERHQSDQETGR